VCDEYHSGPMEQCIGKKTSRRFLQDYLRLVDVKNMVIVRSSSSRTEYVALTYVWGEDKLKRERPRTLSAAVCTDEYGVETIDLPEELPRTGLAMFHPGTFHGTFRPVSIGIR
jgi:hypothetical protein